MGLEQFYRFAKPTLKPNRLLIPITQLRFNEKDIKEANAILDYCHTLEQAGKMKRFVQTPSGGISYRKGVNRGARFDIRTNKVCVEITVKDYPTANLFRFQIKNTGLSTEKTTISGRKAWTEFNRVLKEFGVNIEEFAISKEEGIEVKKTIEKPYIGIRRSVYANRTFTDVHHLDRNSAWIAGICEAFPKLAPAYQKIYNEKKTNVEKSAIYKAILVESQGFMQSAMVNYRYAHISREGINRTNRWIEDMTTKLIRSGRRVIAYNTDGIWYEGNIYHDENEGVEMGQWKHDHTNCTVRFKSNGAYEFVEDGKYNAVVRGLTKLDKVKPRNEWSWGDIYSDEINMFTYNSKEEKFYEVDR